MAGTAVQVVIDGRVQGVGFRAWAVAEAAGRGLGGWVRNRSDGSVEALFIGAPEAVEAMIEACRGGPPLAQVVRITRTAAPDETGPVGRFHARPTS